MFHIKTIPSKTKQNVTMLNACNNMKVWKILSCACVSKTMLNVNMLNACNNMKVWKVPSLMNGGEGVLFNALFSSLKFSQRTANDVRLVCTARQHVKFKKGLCILTASGFVSDPLGRKPRWFQQNI
jgi:hypothetical protein